MNSLLSPSFSPTSLESDSCRLDKGLIIPWICQALTSPMSSCDWCTDSGALPAKNPISSWELLLLLSWVWICVYVYPWFLSDYKAAQMGVLGGLNRPSFGMSAWGMVLAWLGSAELWLSRERSSIYRAAPFIRLSSMAGLWCTVHLLLPQCEK